MGRKKMDNSPKKGVHIMIKSTDLENILDLIKENRTEVKLTRAAAVRVCVAFMRERMENMTKDELEKLEEFFKANKAA